MVLVLAVGVLIFGGKVPIFWGPDFRGPGPWDPVPILQIATVQDEISLCGSFLRRGYFQEQFILNLDYHIGFISVSFLISKLRILIWILI